ncbi:MAG: hypothetical protein U5O39_00220 [Gammaproteobacteria bacterium]|nr:hypothetical protein [Gammaproteobacteria bacterium]
MRRRCTRRFHCANAVAEDFLLEDRFALSGGFECRVEAQAFDPSFGFTTARFEETSPGWRLHVRFEGSGEEVCLTLD